MNTKLKVVRLVFAAAFGSLLWAGCSTPHSSDMAGPVDLLKRRPDTHPEFRLGLDDHSSSGPVVNVIPVTSDTVNEAAGAERRDN